MSNSFIKLLNDKGDIKVYKYMEIRDSDPLHEPNSYYEEYVYNVLDLLKENEKLRDEKVKLLSENQQLKKQKDDVVEYIKKYLHEHIIDDLPDEESKFETEKGIPIPNAKEILLRMLGEIE